MKNTLPWMILPLTLVLFVAVSYLPLPVPPYLDFQVIYHAGIGLLRGIPLYDHPGQVQMIADIAGVQAEQVFVLPFPYPPWYALAAYPLFFLPISVAARLWLLLNVSMLMLSTFLLTEGWEPWKRLVSFPLALLFLPVLGALFVGQYTFPVLLGVALFVYALRNEKPFLIALAIALLTFKPHLGALIILAGFVHLWLRHDAFGRRSLWISIAVLIFLFVIGFLADPAWPLNYLYSLLGFKDISQCNGCISLSMALASLFDVGLDQAIFVSLGLMVGLGYLFVVRRFWILRNAGLFIVTGVCGVLLVSPYLQNYDFILLLIAIIFMAGIARRRSDWMVIGVAYFLPWVGLGLFGRQGNSFLLLAAIVAAGWLFYRTAKMLDLQLPTLYNQ